MFVNLFQALISRRTNSIVARLYTKHNFRCSSDTKELIKMFVVVGTLSNNQIIQEVLEMHTVNVKELVS